MQELSVPTLIEDVQWYLQGRLWQVSREIWVYGKNYSKTIGLYRLLMAFEQKRQLQLDINTSATHDSLKNHTCSIKCIDCYTFIKANTENVAQRQNIDAYIQNTPRKRNRLPDLRHDKTGCDRCSVSRCGCMCACTIVYVCAWVCMCLCMHARVHTH